MEGTTRKLLPIRTDCRPSGTDTMSYAARHSKSKAAEDWAAKRRAAMDRAKKLREERKRGLVSDDHTFKPASVPLPLVCRAVFGTH